MPKINETGRWRTEIQLAEGFRDQEFGTYTKDKITRAGENIDYFERGFSQGYAFLDDDTTMTLNIFHAVIKNIVPSLWFKNPSLVALPQDRASSDSSFYAKHVMNFYYGEEQTGADSENKLAIWDSYNLGKGYTVVGYATRFGMDIPDEEAQAKKKDSLSNNILEKLGIKKKKKEDVVFPELTSDIIAESPYIKHASPFNILVDPRATSLSEATWWAHDVERTVEQVKANKKFKNTEGIRGSDPDLPEDHKNKLGSSELEAFRTVRLYEVHYKQPEGFYLLVLVKDGDTFHPLYHEKSVYRLDDWQIDEIDFSGHRHKYYKKSEMDKIKTLQDRFTTTVDAILEQVDRMVPKVLVDETGISDEGKRNLESGDIGAIVYTNKNPREVVAETGLTQLKADLKALLDELITIVTIQTGLTRSQLLGVATGETATAETIAQGGQNLRQGDMGQEVTRFANSQANKLWKIIQQFVSFHELEIITGESGINPETGQPIFTWLPDVTPEMDNNLRNANIKFKIEVGSSQKLDTATISKRIENLISILARTDVIAILQQQGKKLDIGEIIKSWLKQSPEVFPDINRIISDINQMTQGQLAPDQIQNILAGGQQGGPTAGSQTNALRAQRAQGPVSGQQILREAAQV